VRYLLILRENNRAFPILIQNLLHVYNEELNGYVIYSPTKENPSWQVNVMKGRQLPQCGFVQYQYSQKVQQPTLSKHLSINKVQQHLQKYVVDIEKKHLQDLKWQLFCQK